MITFLMLHGEEIMNMKRVRVKLSYRIIQELEGLGYSKGHKYVYKVKQIDGVNHIFRLPMKFDIGSKWEYLGVV